jgi:aminoglycoside/choline kinase family phosphotransferase
VSQIASEGVDFILLLDDLAPAVQGDQIAGCDANSARLAVEALAGLHGSCWCDPKWLTFGDCTMPKPNAALANGLGELARSAADQTISELGSRLDWQDRRTIAAAADLVEPWLLLEPGRFSLLHGDFRLDNLLFSADSTAVWVVDWQSITIGLPARDLAYFLGTCLDPQHRRASERQLVETYHATLLRHGVPNYEFSLCYRDYRMAMLQAPLLTTFGYAFVAPTDRGDDMVVAMLKRGCRAMQDLDTLGLVRQLTGQWSHNFLT